MGRTVMGAVAVAMLAAVGLAGCASADDEPDLGAIGSVRAAADIQLPMDRYVLTAAQAKLVDDARLESVRRCAKRFGFDVRTAETGAVPGNSHARLYGILSLSEATASGYRVPTAGRTGAEPEPSRATGGWNPSNEEFMVVRGVDRVAGNSAAGVLVRGLPVPDGGCAGEADRTIGKGAKAVRPELAALPEQIALKAHQTAEKDSRVRAPFSDWSKCMSRLGYHYQNPWEPNDRKWGPSLTPEEKATAEADVRCRTETNLVGIWMAVETAYQTGMAAERDDELAQLRQSLDVRMANAKSIVDGDIG